MTLDGVSIDVLVAGPARKLRAAGTAFAIEATLGSPAELETLSAYLASEAKKWRAQAAPPKTVPPTTVDAALLAFDILSSKTPEEA